MNVAKIIRKELRPEVQSAVYRAKKENKFIKEEAIRFQYGEQSKTINIEVMPLIAKQYEEPFFLVLFEDVSTAAAHLRQTIELSTTPEGRENVKSSQIRELKEELESSKQYLQTVIETQEATNEELRSAMEEVQSSNEELQSTNEELETAKEELQSSNEELTTLNDELKNRNQALARLNDNVTNLSRNVDPAVVMVDCNLKIRLFTPSAQKILNLVPSDAGLPISNVHLAISVPDLEKTILEVITTLGAMNKEVIDEKGRSYEMRIRPYVTEDNKIDGAVLSFIDIDVLKKHEDELRGEEEKYRTLAENAPDIIARLDRNLRYLYINSSFEKTTGIPSKNFVGKTNQEIGLPRKFMETWTKILENVIQTGKEVKGEFEFPSPEGTKIYQYAIVPEFSVNGAAETLLAILKDITERKKAEVALVESEQKYRTIVETAAEGIVIAKPDGAHIFVNNRLAEMFGYSTDELLRKSSFDLMSEEEQKRQVAQMRRGLENEQILYREFEFRRKDGSFLWAACNASPLFDENGKHVANIAMFSDITERKKADEALRKSEKEYSSLFTNMIDGFAYCQMIFDEKSKPIDFVYLQINGAFERITGLKRDMVVGKKVTDAIPGIKAANPELFEIYGRVALTGQKEKFEVFFKPLSIWLSISVYCPAKGYFAAVFEDITQRKLQEREIENLSKFPAENPNPVFRIDGKGIILYCNQAGASVLTGWDSKVGGYAPEQISQVVTDALASSKRIEIEETYGANTFSLLFAPVALEGYVNIYANDITERKKTEAEREIMVEFLRIANAAEGTSDLIEGALDFFQKQCGCEAVGVRLKEAEDYPYYETKGFPSEHVQLENKLCARDEAGCVIRDSKGKPILECMCGNIICGRFDPSQKFFTENGSFWTNSTTQLIANTTSKDRQGTTRNRCNREGYESVALIPLRVGDNQLGLLQLNDRRKDMFTLETIQMWERIADRLALALSKTIADEALRESEVKFRTVSDFAYNWEYWIAPDGNLIYVSPSSKRITGYDANEFLKDPKLLTQIVHTEDKSIVGSHFDLINSEELHAVDFRIVTRSGDTRWISHSCRAVFDDNGTWIGRRASNRDITERKTIEQRLSNSLEESYRRGSEVSALLTASRSVLTNKEFQYSARAIFDTCKELIGATAGYVALLSKGGKQNEVLFLDAGGRPCTVDPSLPMPIRGLRAEAYKSGDAGVENDFPQSKYCKFMPTGHVQLDNVLFAPLTIEKKVVGVIGLANKTGGFTQRDHEMAMAFGEIA